MRAETTHINEFCALVRIDPEQKGSHDWDNLPFDTIDVHKTPEGTPVAVVTRGSDAYAFLFDVPVDRAHNHIPAISETFGSAYNLGVYCVNGHPELVHSSTAPWIARAISDRNSALARIRARAPDDLGEQVSGRYDGAELRPKDLRGGYVGSRAGDL